MSHINSNHQDFNVVTTPTARDLTGSRVKTLNNSSIAAGKARGFITTEKRSGDSGQAARLGNADNAESADQIKLNFYSANQINQFKIKRKQRNMTMDQVARELCVPRKDIQDFESGKLQKNGGFSNKLQQFLRSN